jgi:hypothetical protein
MGILLEGSANANGSRLMTGEFPKARHMKLMVSLLFVYEVHF